MIHHQFKSSRPPPTPSSGWMAWFKHNLFSTFFHGMMTLVLGAFIAFISINVFQWAIWQADWLGNTRADCQQAGACWVFIHARLEQFFFGFYPESQHWRPLLFFASLLLIIFLLIYEKNPYRRSIALFAISLYPISIGYLLYGGFWGLPIVETHQWGGLLITLIIALIGILASLPIGILLALCRRSELPVLRSISTIYIEIWRGVPLITVLFMASVMLPLFFDSETDTNKLFRALIGVVLFSAAYIAEVVRGGLQALPQGQYEAADALGLSYAKKMGLIILPQALTITIPSLVNTFIGLFKDTSLVLIIGMFDVLGIGQSANTDPEWLGFATESYVFVALIFWICCFSMSHYSQYLERKLNTKPAHS